MSRPTRNIETETNTRSSIAKRAQRGFALVAIGALMSFAAACGAPSGSKDVETGGSSAKIVAEAKAAVAKNRAGTDRELPATAPKPQAGKNIWYISCIQAAEGCSRPAAGAKDAAEALGWKVTVHDGKANPDVISAGVRAAVADKADAIIFQSDCVLAKGALQEAKKAGVKTFGIFAMDCDDPLSGSGEPLFDAQLEYNDGLTFRTYTEGPFSRSQADYVIAKTEGKAKIIAFTQNDALIADHLGRGFLARIKDCATCEVVAEVPFTQNDFITGKLQSKAEAALTKNPDANVLYSPHDVALILGISQAVVASGRSDEILVPGLEGLTPNIGFIRDNKGQDSIAGSPANRVGWAAVDGVNRMLQGQPQIDEGIGMQTLDADGPLPEDTPYYDGNIGADGKRKVDYIAHYKNIWGLS